MPFTVLNIITDAPIEPGAELTFDYPEGKGRDRYLGGSLHTLSFQGSFFRSPKDFTVIFKEEKIHVYWEAKITIPDQRILTIQLDEPLSGSYQDARSGQIVPSLVRSQMFILDMGRPIPPQQSIVVDHMNFTSTLKMGLGHNLPFSPMRNITVTAHGEVEEGATMRIRGLDLYNREVTEEIALVNEETALGKKCFRHVLEVEVNRPIAVPLSVGIGEALGFPVFLPGSGYVMKYFVNSRGLAGGVILPGFEAERPSATTPDVRGSFTPPEDIAMDGHNHFQLLVSLFNPANIGLDEYADFNLPKAEKPPLAPELDPAAVLNAPLNQTPATAFELEPTQADVRSAEEVQQKKGPMLSLSLPPRPEQS